MGQVQRSSGLTRPKGHDIGRWAHANVKLHFYQWRANPNPDLDLNPDLATFPNASGFGFGLDLYIFNESDLDLVLRFLRRWI